MNITPEERERRRERALALGQQRRPDGTRVFGGPQPGSGRPRKKRVSELLADKAREHAEEIWDALHDGLKKGVPQAVRNQTAEILVRVEKQELELAIAEEEHLAKMKRDELKELVMEKLEKLVAAGAIQLPAHPDIDAGATRLALNAGDPVDGVAADGPGEGAEPLRAAV